MNVGRTGRTDLWERGREVATAISENRPSTTVHPYDYKYQNDFFLGMLSETPGADLRKLREEALDRSLSARNLQQWCAGLCAASALTGLVSGVAMAHGSTLALWGLGMAGAGFLVGIKGYQGQETRAQVNDLFRHHLDAWDTVLAGGELSTQDKAELRPYWTHLGGRWEQR